MDGILRVWAKSEQEWYQGGEDARLSQAAARDLIDWVTENRWHLFVTHTPKREVSEAGMAALTMRCLAEWSSLFGVKRALWSVEPFEQGNYHVHMLLWTSYWKTFRACANRCKTVKCATNRVCETCESISTDCRPPLPLSWVSSKAPSGWMPWWKLANEYFGSSLGWTRTYYILDKATAAARYVAKYLLKKTGVDATSWGIYTPNERRA